MKRLVDRADRGARRISPDSRPQHARTRPLIGVVGEIFCRLTPFTNDFLIRKIEEFGGECTLAHIVEWVWYTNLEQRKRLHQSGRTFSKAMLAANIKNHIQHKDEHRLYKVFEEDFRGYEEPSVQEIFEYSEPYLPHDGALGEMTLSVGQGRLSLSSGMRRRGRHLAIHLHERHRHRGGLPENQRRP